MGIQQYEFTFDRAKVNFDFVSRGPKGDILKTVRYTKVKTKGVSQIYNLGFGDRLIGSEDIDDLTVSDNQDRDKILATVLATILIFSKRYPKAIIFFKGSTASRTRLYQMAINKYFEVLQDDFDIEGYDEEDSWSTFQQNTSYSAFLIRRKLF